MTSFYGRREKPDSQIGRHLRGDGFIQTTPIPGSWAQQLPSHLSDFHQKPKALAPLVPLRRGSRALRGLAYQ